MMFAEAIELCDLKQYSSARKLFEQLEDQKSETKGDVSNEDCLFNAATCLAFEGRYSQALELYSRLRGTELDLLYNRALCNYHLGEYQLTIQDLDTLISESSDKYPNAFVKEDSRSDGDSTILDRLSDSFLIESMNLKSAALFRLATDSCLEPAKCLENLLSSPLKSLDCVTLHNKAIYELDDNLESAVMILNHLLNLHQSSDTLKHHVPKETFRNSMILACRSLEQARDFRLKFREELVDCFSSEELKFLDAYLEDSDEIACKKLNKILDLQLGLDDSVKDLITVVASHQSAILWRNDRYKELEDLLVKCEADDFSDPILWTTTMAHSIFMQDFRYDESAKCYSSLLMESDSLDRVDPFVLGNLCVSYVLIGQNTEAELLIKRIEDLEQDHEKENLDELGGFRRNCTSISMINMIIGTLYCIKNNYAFGLTRIIKSICPVESKLNLMSWMYLKKSLMSLLDSHCKQMIYAKDDLFQQILSFLIDCEKFCAQKLDATRPSILSKFKGKAINLNDYKIEMNERELDLLFHLQQLQKIHQETRYLRWLVSTIFYD